MTIEIDFVNLPRTVAIVGSRSFYKFGGKIDEYFSTQVDKLVSSTDSSTTIVSGGAVGIDSYAEDAATKHLRLFVPILPDEAVPSPARFFERNTRLVDYIKSHEGVIIAFSDVRNWNGTRDTLTKAHEKNVPYLNIRVSSRPIKLVRLDKYQWLW